MFTKSTAHPSVWVGCLTCYNTGDLNGEWFSIEEVGEITPDDLHENPTTHEELWCFDLEGFPTEIEEMGLETAALWGELFTEIGEDLWEPFIAWVNNCTVNIYNLPDSSSFKNQYRGWWLSFSDYLAEGIELFQEDWPETAIRYFDEESYERDAGYVYNVVNAPDGGVFVFANL